jgi:hypothetical protein
MHCQDITYTRSYGAGLALAEDQKNVVNKGQMIILYVL